MTSPRSWPASNVLHWGCGFTKAQNKKELGFINGEFHTPLLDHLVDLVHSMTIEFKVSHTLAMGYSMGGYGVLQLAAHSPQCFDVVIAAAGYGKGTYVSEADCGAPPAKVLGYLGCLHP